MSVTGQTDLQSTKTFDSLGFLSVRPSVCQSICPYVSVRPSVSLLIVRPFVYLFATCHLSVCLSSKLSLACPFDCDLYFVHPSVCPYGYKRLVEANRQSVNHKTLRKKLKIPVENLLEKLQITPSSNSPHEKTSEALQAIFIIILRSSLLFLL